MYFPPPDERDNDDSIAFGARMRKNVNESINNIDPPTSMTAFENLGCSLFEKIRSKKEIVSFHIINISTRVLP